MRKIQQVQTAPKLAHRWSKELVQMAEANRYEAEMARHMEESRRDIEFNFARQHLRECMRSKDYTFIAKYRTAKKVLREIWEMFETTGMPDFERQSLLHTFSTIRSDRDRLYRIEGPVFPIIKGGPPEKRFDPYAPYWYTNMWPMAPKKYVPKETDH